MAASNIAWPAPLDCAAYHLLARSGVQGVEVAPTRIWPEWDGISATSVRKVKQAIAGERLEVSSLQAVLFGRPELQMFGDDAEFARHLCFCADLAGQLGAKAVVLGAPKNRDRGALSEDEAFNSAVEILQPIARAYANAGVALAFEANPVQYGCNFITHAADAARLVRAVGSAGLRLHLDTACATLAGEDVAELVRNNADILAHFHASEPMLSAVGAAAEPHRSAAQALRDVAYQGWVAIEMRVQEEAEPALQTAADFTIAVYGERA